jgi:DNA polymerase IIIc chi subunit
LVSNFSTPAISIDGSALQAACRPFSLPWPQGLLIAHRDQASGRARFIIALNQIEHAATQQAALGVDLVDCERQTARDRFTGLRRSAG